MKIAVIIVRTLLGLLFLFASITYFFNLIQPPPMTGAVKAFNEGLAGTGYFFTVVKITEFVCGLAFLIGRFVPLAAVVLAPIAVNILLFHLFLDRTGLPVAIFVVLALLFLAYAYRRSYAALFEPRPALS
jgi:putative oxidoreductase